MRENQRCTVLGCEGAPPRVAPPIRTFRQSESTRQGAVVGTILVLIPTLFLGGWLFSHFMPTPRPSIEAPHDWREQQNRRETRIEALVAELQPMLHRIVDRHPTDPRSDAEFERARSLYAELHAEREDASRLLAGDATTSRGFAVWRLCKEFDR